MSDGRRLSTIITVLRMTFIFFGDGLKTTIQLVLPDNSQEAPIIAKIMLFFPVDLTSNKVPPPNPSAGACVGVAAPWHMTSVLIGSALRLQLRPDSSSRSSAANACDMTGW